MTLFKRRNAVEDKLLNWGDEKVFKREEWVDPLLITGDDLTIFSAEIMNIGFNKILNGHTPKHDTAFISLCTKTRPYYKSRKWATFIKEFGDYAEFIVASNAGIIPFEFWDSYPYTTYEGRHEKKHDNLYIKTFYERFEIFFSHKKYKKIVFNLDRV